MKPRKIKKLYVMMALFFLEACGGDPSLEPHQSTLRPSDPPSLQNSSEDPVTRPQLQIFRKGERAPLSRIEGLREGDSLFLEARVGGTVQAVHWFSADPFKAYFEESGPLHLVQAGTFYIAAYFGELSHYLLIQVAPSPDRASALPAPLPFLENDAEQLDAGQSQSRQCSPLSCERASPLCGRVEDGCGGFLECGPCSNPPPSPPPPPPAAPPPSQPPAVQMPPPVCGDQVCERSENRVNCALDCDPTLPPRRPSDPYVDEVTAFTPGATRGAQVFGFEPSRNSPGFPRAVLGPPHGFGLGLGNNEDVISLGMGGAMTLRSATPILNGVGFDFVVFENPLHPSGNRNSEPFYELAEVSVSQDGVNFFTFPCQRENRRGLFLGCAGVHAVVAYGDRRDWGRFGTASEEEFYTQIGGDRFDLQELGLGWALYIRLNDLGTRGITEGNPGASGFDLDAIAILNQ